MDKRIIILILVLVGLGAVLLFINPEMDYKKRVPPLNQVTVAWIGPLTGSASVLGVDNLNAIKLALTQYNKNKKPGDPLINLEVADDQYDAEKTLVAYHSLLKNKKPTIFFINTYSALQKLALEAEKDNVIVIDPIDNDRHISNLSPNFFLIGKQTESLAALISSTLLENNMKRIAVFYYASDDFMPLVASTLELIIHHANPNMKIFSYPYQKTENNFSEIFLKAQANHPDAYVLLGYKELKNVMAIANKLKIQEPFFSINTAMSYLTQESFPPHFIAITTVLDGNILMGKQFLQQYETVYAKPVMTEWVALQAYDAANILFKSISQAVNIPGDFVDNLRNELCDATYLGVSGNISIEANGSSRGIYPGLYRSVNGKLEKIK